MDKQIYNTLLSPEKMGLFEEQFSKDPFEGYLINVEISKIFYVWLHFFEIILRNRIARYLDKTFPEWYKPTPSFLKKIHRDDTRHRLYKKVNDIIKESTFTNKQNKFINKVLQREQQNQLRIAIERIIQHNKDINRNNLISELNLGFWTCLFLKTYEQSMWNNKGYKEIFPSLKTIKSYTRIKRDLDFIRKIRNRIFHNEQILVYSPNKTLDLLKLYTKASISLKYHSILDDIETAAGTETLNDLWVRLDNLQDKEHLKDPNTKVKYNKWWSKMKFPSQNTSRPS